MAVGATAAATAAVKAGASAAPAGGDAAAPGPAAAAAAASPSVGDVGPATGAPVPGGAERPVDPNVGRVVDVEVIAVHDNETIVRLADGREGAIDSRHLHSEVAVTKEPITPGRTIKAALLARASSGGRVSMSRTWALQIEGFERAREAMESKQYLKAVATKTVKGGVVFDVGVRAFLPTSQAELEPGESLGTLVGQELDVSVVSVDESRRTVVVSRRGPVRAERRKRTGDVIRSLEVGERRKGVVKRVEDYGAFVDIGGIDGLVHRSELTWGRVRSAKGQIKVGDEVEVVVLDVKVGKRRVGLSVRQASEDPFSGLEPGARLEGEVISLVEYGAFIRISDTVEGLCHLSELAEYPVRHPEEVVIPGDQVMVEVVSIDAERRRVSLSIARAVRL